MAVVSCLEMLESRSGDESLPTARSYSRTFRVVTSDKTDGINVVGAAVGLPVRGAAHPTDAGAFCKSRRFQCSDASGTVWTVECSYDNSPAASDPDAGIEDPVQRRTRFIPSYVPYDVILEKDIHGNAFRNSAGGQFADPVIETRLARRLTFIRNESNLTALEGYIGRVNSREFLGYPAGEIKLVSGEPSELTFEGEYAFYVYTYIFDHRPNKKNDDGQTVSGWAREILDCGMRRIFESGGVKFSFPILMGDPPTPVNEPVNLDGEGQPLDDQTAQHFLTFETCEEADFNDLNLSLS